MKIFIDCTGLLSWKGNYTGIQNVCINLIYEALYMFGNDCLLFKYDILAKKIITISPEDININLHDYNFVELDLCCSQNLNEQCIFLIIGGVWDYIEILDILSNFKSIYNIKLYSIIYDLIPFILPFNYKQEFIAIYKKYIDKILSLSDKVLPISKSTYKDLLKYCNNQLLVNKKIKIIRLGDKKNNSFKMENKLNKDKFILLVGTIEARKNYRIIYRAYKYAHLMNIDLPRALIVGQKGTLTNDLIEIISNDITIKNKIDIKFNINDKDLAKLYQKCLFTVYPSLYEGWGLPVAESMIYGKFCISSNSSSMPEISGNLIEYFNPYNEKELAELIKKYSNDKILNNRVDNIRINYKPTSWKDTLLQILK